MKLVLHPLTETATNQLCLDPCQAVLLSGPAGSGKTALADLVCQKILRITEVSDQAYVRVVEPVDGKAISIESIRQLQSFLSLKIPGRVSGIRRVIIIRDAQLLTIESQNALLKTLEEPPLDTMIIMTATSADNLLPTIGSRLQEIVVRPPARAALTEHFAAQGHSAKDIDQALLLGAELPGLTSAILSGDDSHPLLQAIATARGILQSKAYDRLLLVDGLSKQKPQCLAIITVLGRMARLALLRGGNGAERWQNILEATFIAERQLSHNTQTKLVMTNLFLTI